MILPLSPDALPRDLGRLVLVAGTPVLDPTQPINQVGATMILLWTGLAVLDTSSRARHVYRVARQGRN